MKLFLYRMVGLLIFILEPVSVMAQIVPGVCRAVTSAKTAAARAVQVSAEVAGKGACHWALRSSMQHLPTLPLNAKTIETNVTRQIRKSAIAAGPKEEEGKATAKLERTLVLIKPDAIEKRLSGVILDRLDKLGLELIGAKVVPATEELIRAHYKHLEGTPFVDGVVDYMMGKYNNIPDHKIYAFVFQGEDAIAKVRAEIGSTNPEKADPSTIRGSYGCIANGVIQNCVHASGAPEEAEEEIALWFSKGEVIK